MAEGTPQDVAATKASYTGQYLKPVMARKPATPSAPSGRLAAGKSEGATKNSEGANTRADGVNRSRPADAASLAP